MVDRYQELSFRMVWPILTSISNEKLNHNLFLHVQYQSLYRYYFFIDSSGTKVFILIRKKKGTKQIVLQKKILFIGLAGLITLFPYKIAQRSNILMGQH